MQASSEIKCRSEGVGTALPPLPWSPAQDGHGGANWNSFKGENGANP